MVRLLLSFDFSHCISNEESGCSNAVIWWLSRWTCCSETQYENSLDKGTYRIKYWLNFFFTNSHSKLNTQDFEVNEWVSVKRWNKLKIWNEFDSWCSKTKIQTYKRIKKNANFNGTVQNRKFVALKGLTPPKMCAHFVLSH